MNKKKVLLGFCDGFAQGIILYLLLAFTPSVYAENVSVEALLIIAGGLALLSPFGYYVFVLKSPARKTIMAMSAISLLGFILAIILSLLLAWGQLLFPVRGLVCSSAGMIQQFEVQVFVFVSAFFRVLLLIITRTRNKVGT